MQNRAQVQGAFLLIWIRLIWVTALMIVSNDRPRYLNIPPVIHDGPSTHIIYNTGGRIILPCRASGSPQPRFHWYRNGEQLETSNDSSALYYVKNASISGDLHLKTVSSVMEGYYQCFAINSIGKSMSNISFVQEAVFEDRTLRRRVNNVTVAEGAHITLPCNHFRSIPAASVAWYWANHTLEKTRPVLVPLSRRIAVDDYGNLIFTVVTKVDALEGIIYECHAYNYITGQTSTGSCVKLILLPVMYKTDSVPELILSSSKVSAAAGTDVTLTCLFSSRLMAQIEWSRNGSAQLPASSSVTDDGQRLMLKQVSMQNSGSYVCRGSNAIGQTQATISLVVIEPPRLKRPLQSQTVNVGGSASFHCKTEYEDSVKVEWFFNSQTIDNATLALMGWFADGDKLVLPNTRPKDTGIFTCNVSNGYGSVVSNAYLLVLYADEEDQSGVSGHYVTSITYHIENITEAAAAAAAAASNDSFLIKTFNYSEQNATQSVQLSTSDLTTALSTLSTDDAPYLSPGLQVPDSNRLISDGVGLLQNKDLISAMWIIIPIVFILVFLSFLYHRMKRNERIYRVYKQEQRRGCHVVDYDSDDSGYGEQKMENAINHMKMTLPPVPDHECYL